MVDNTWNNRKQQIIETESLKANKAKTTIYYHIHSVFFNGIY